MKFFIIILVLVISFNLLWGQEIQPSNTTSKLNSVYFIDQNTGWIVGENGTILKTINGGENWEQKTYNNQTQFIYYSVYFTNKDTGWIAGSDGYVDYGADEINCILLKTIDGCESWQEIPFNGQGLSNIQFINDSTGWIVQTVSWRNENILKTTDGGNSWMSKFESPYEGIRELSFLDHNNGWAIGHDNVYKTTDGGENWIAVLQSSEALLKLFFFNGSIGWILYESGFYKTTNGGMNWNTYETLLLHGWRPKVMRFVNEDIGICATDHNNGSLYTTIDGGENFNFFYALDISDIFILDINHCWAIGKEGKILKYSLENLTTVSSNNKKQIPLCIELLQNYPNPFNAATTIKYNLQKSCNVSVKIYNLSGHEVENLITGFQIKGEHEITWQSKGLPSGIYFYRLQAGDFSETKKLILQK